MTAPTLTLDGETILADGVALLNVGHLEGRAFPASFHSIRPRWLNVSWPWNGDTGDLTWAIGCQPFAVGGVVWAAVEEAAQHMEVARREADPDTRAAHLREFDRLMQVAALWRRFIP